MKRTSPASPKRIVQRIAFRTGFTSLRGRLLSRIRGRGLWILFGHHVLDDDSPVSGYLKASDLYDRLMYLQAHYDVVSLPEAAEWLRNPRGRGRLVVVTFDDGYRDNLTNGLPVLKATGTPATIFVSTQPILDGSGFWFDRVRQAIRGKSAIHLKVEWFQPRLAAKNQPEKVSLADEIVAILKRDGPATRDAKIAELMSIVGEGAGHVQPHQQALSLQELRTLAAEPLVTIGAHTHTHSILSACTQEEAVNEVRRNLEELARATDKAPRYFAYPNGGPEDFSERDFGILRDAGIEAAVTTIRGINHPGQNPYALKRHPLGVGEVARFAWHIERDRR